MNEKFWIFRKKSWMQCLFFVQNCFSPKYFYRGIFRTLCLTWKTQAFKQCYLAFRAFGNCKEGSTKIFRPRENPRCLNFWKFWVFAKNLLYHEIFWYWRCCCCKNRYIRWEYAQIVIVRWSLLKKWTFRC